MLKGFPVPSRLVRECGLARPHNWLFYEVTLPPLSDAIRKYARGKLVDIGCGKKPYRALVAPFVTEHVGVDHNLGRHGLSEVDLVGSAYEIPCDSSTYDTALCTDVLEHLEEPSDAIAETFRVLKPGGHAIYTVPLFWHLHEQPRDFFRFTKYGLAYLFGKNGFEAIEITPLSGFSAMMAQELMYFVQRFRRGGRANPLWWLIPPLGHVIQYTALALNKVDHSELYCMEYLLVARKPAQ